MTANDITPPAGTRSTSRMSSLAGRIRLVRMSSGEPWWPRSPTFSGQLAALMDEAQHGRPRLHELPQGAPPEIAFDQPARTPQRRDQATHQRRRHLPQRRRNHTARRRNPSRAERRVGRLKEIHDTGIHRSDKRQSHTQAAHRGSLSVPALPAGYRVGRQALTPPAGTRSTSRMSSLAGRIRLVRMSSGEPWWPRSPTFSGQQLFCQGLALPCRHRRQQPDSRCPNTWVIIVHGEL